MYVQETHCTSQEVEKSSIQPKSLSIKNWLNKILSYHGIVACLKCNGAEVILAKNILAFSEFPDDFAISMSSKSENQNLAIYLYLQILAKT